MVNGKRYKNPVSGVREPCALESLTVVGQVSSVRSLITKIPFSRIQLLVTYPGKG